MFGIDDLLIGGAIAKIGTSLLGGVMSEIQGTPELESLNWESERAMFMGRLREAIEARGEEAVSRVRLETERVGTPLSGSYLQAVTDIEKNLDELFAKEVGAFSIQQAGAKREWAGKQALVRLEGRQGRNQMWQEVIGGIGGAVGGAFTSQYEGKLFESYLDKMVGPLGKLEGVDRTTPGKATMEKLIEDIYLEVFGTYPKYSHGGE